MDRSRGQCLFDRVYEGSTDGLQVTALKEAVRDYDANKWKIIGQQVGKPPKVSLSFSRPYYANT